MSVMKIAPSILSVDFAKLGEASVLMAEGKADMIHFDVMDGQFVPEISFGEVVLRSLRKVTELPIDVHLMIVDPEKSIDLFARDGADYITVHYEACRDNVSEIIDQIHAHHIPAGVSIKPGTPVEAVFPYLSKLDRVLIMTVEPGFGGQPFIEASTDRIRVLREEIQRLGLSVEIQVDGGIDFNTVKKAAGAGADVFVSGSALFKGDLVGNIEKMRSILKEFE